VSYTQLPFAGRPGFVNDVVYGNPALRNERAREWEVGGDAGFLGGRVSAEGTYYNRLVSDLLFFRPLATSTGFARQFFPIGSMSNKGVELLVRTTNVDRPRLTWTSTATYARNRNRVERPVDAGLPVGRRLPQPHPRRRAGGRVLRLVRARDCVTGALLVDSLGPLPPQQPDGRHGRDARAAPAISRGTCNDSLNRVIGDPNPTSSRRCSTSSPCSASSACAPCSTARSATT
jgi:outer membrane receptor protein involved in Fe transport